ncbi:MAG TPA: hypothetical protein VEU33_43535, partial [Archangium sp.]|nr:hypothetical protein [Archangium sp.]
ARLTSHLQDAVPPQLSAHREQLEGYGASAASALRASGNPDPRSVEDSAAHFHDMLKRSHGQAMEALGQWQDTTREELSNLNSGLDGELSELMMELSTSAEEAGTNLIRELQTATHNAEAGLDHVVTTLEGNLSTGADAALAELSDGAEQFHAEVGNIHRAALEAFAQFVDDGLRSEDALLADARQDMPDATQRIGIRYDELKDEAERRSGEEEVPATRIHRGIWSSITGFFSGLVASVQHWFANTFGEFWGGLLFGILTALVIVAAGWLVLTGLGALLVAAGITAKVAAIVVLVVGVVAAVGIGIYSRFQEFYADNPGENAGFWRGLGLVTLGILDMTGIPFIVESAIGQRAFGRKLTSFERGERLGSGLVFFVSAIKTIRGLIRARPKPVVEAEGDGRPVELPKRAEPNPAEAPPAGMSDALRAVRALLKDPRAISQFDDMFARMKDSAKMERVIEGMRQKGDLEQRLIDDWERAHPEPHGEALHRVPALKERADALRAEIEAFRAQHPEVEGLAEMLKAIRGEAERLKNMLEGRVKASEEGVQGTENNINGVEEEFRIAQREQGVDGVNRKFPLDGTGVVEVDVVSKKGRRWIDSKRVKPFGLESSDWVGSADKQGLKVQAEEMLRAAKQNPVDGVPPEVVFEFPLGVSREVAKALRAMGVEVSGPIIETLPGPVLPIPVRDREEKKEKTGS